MGNLRRYGKILTGRLKDGYIQYNLRNPGKRRTVKCHTLVLEAFKGKRPEGMECRHLDGCRDNNALSNLVWGTHQENIDDKSSHGTNVKGENQRSAKLTEEKVLELRERIRNGETAAAIAKEWGLLPSMIRAAANGTKWKHLPGAVKRTSGPTPKLKELTE